MNLLRTAFATGFSLLAFGSAFGQADSTCIVAGRLNDAGQWAPRMAGVQLLTQDGKAISSADKTALASVKQAKLSSPALLSKCDLDAQLALGSDEAGAKKPVPAVGPGVVNVEAVSYPKLRRGGQLVELKITVPAERVSMITR